jgi:hypothetical protein
MTTEKDIPASYGRLARYRLAVSAAAADIADAARALVATASDGFGHAGEIAESARRIAVDANDLLTYAVAYERSRGTTWPALAERFDTSRQNVAEKYKDRVAQLDDDVLICWLLGDVQRGDAPDAAAEPGRFAPVLDEWFRVHRPDKPANRPVSETMMPVSIGLDPMSLAEHAALLAAGAELVERARKGGHWDLRAGRVELELGYARRRVELYERQLATETAGGRLATEETGDLLSVARFRVERLEQQLREETR